MDSAKRESAGISVDKSCWIMKRWIRARFRAWVGNLLDFPTKLPDLRTIPGAII
jgi:hypothetical protein